MTLEKRRATLAAGTIDYLVAGAGEPLLCLHTSGGPYWTPLIASLAATRRIYLPVLPGFDGSPMLANVSTFTDLADLAADFARTVIGGDPVDVFGASFGGRIALWMAARSPEVVGRLVLEAPAGVALGALPLALDRQAMIAGLFAYPEKAAGLRPSDAIAASNGVAFRAYGGTLAVDEALVALLPGIEAHTLVVMGTLDVITPPQAGWTLAATMPHVNLSYVYDAAHAVQVDQSEAMLRLVRPFFDKGPAFIVASREYA